MAGREALPKLRIWACILGLASSAQVLDQAHLRLRSAHDADSARTIIQGALKAPDHNIIICNAYANAKPLDVINVHTQQRLTEDGQLDYKSCKDFKVPLLEGDRLEFKVGNSSVGIFRATGLPQSKASLLLIASRRDNSSLNAVFTSHAFAESGSPQVAVVDTYGGKETGKVKIMDVKVEQGQDASKQPRVEELHFNSVVALGAGDYQVTLQSDGQQDIAKVALHVTANRANYVVMRTGLQSAQKSAAQSAFPQELVVYGEEESSNSLAASQLKLSALAAMVAGLTAAML
mmetsp:Transcript_123521/g.360709  ORF Transcript_123521/g.360709 Transcript_123521/m.360709 type:complete len:290 (-) Transcript_123521:70-939(-)